MSEDFSEVNICPCKNCITLAVCKDKINLKDNKFDFDHLMIKCSILRKYIESDVEISKFELVERTFEVVKSILDVDIIETRTDHLVIDLNPVGTRCTFRGVYCSRYDKVIETVAKTIPCPVCGKDF